MVTPPRFAGEGRGRCAASAVRGGEEPASGAGLAAGEAGSSCGPASAGSAEGRCTGLGQTWELRVARERVLGFGAWGSAGLAMG